MADTPATPVRPAEAPERDVPEAPSRRRRLRLPTGRGRRPFLILGGVAVLVLLSIGAWLLLTAGQESTDDATVDADVVTLSAAVAGPVNAVPVRENQHVKKGDLLIQIEDADYVARVRQAEAEVAVAQGQAAAADNQVAIAQASATGGLSSAQAVVSGSSVEANAARAQVQAARAGLRRARAEARRATAELQRARRLSQAGAMAAEQFETLQAQNDTANAAVAEGVAQLQAAEAAQNAAQSRIAEAQGRLRQSTPIESQIAVAEANARIAHSRVDAAEAALQAAKVQLSHTRVVAPEDGVVSELGARQGEYAQQGRTLASLVPDTFYVTANFKETQIGQMRPGQHAQIKIDAYPGRKFDGRVVSLSGGTGAQFSLLPAENATGNFVKVVQRVPVRIAFAKPPDVPMRAGLSVVATVDVD